MSAEPIPPITLDPATPDDAAVLENLLELYVHDLSPAFAIEVGADGRFGYPKLGLYWSEPERRFALLVRHAGRLAGFAFATIGSPASDDPDVLDVAEFFVLRRHRRSGVGGRAAALLWDRFPGRSWVVRVSEGNPGALLFWPEVIRDYTRGAFAETVLPGRPHPWRVFTLASRPATAQSR